MKKDLTYNEAFTKLEELVGELEDGNIQLEELAAKVHHANELIVICESKLRKIEEEVSKNLPKE